MRMCLLVRADDADDALGVGDIVENDLHVILTGTGEGDVAVIPQSFQNIAIGPETCFVRGMWERSTHSPAFRLRLSGLRLRNTTSKTRRFL